MPTPVVASSGSGKPGTRRSLRADALAIVAAVSIVALIDSEIIAYGVPGIMTGAELFDLPQGVAYGALAVLGAFALWLSVWLVRQVWTVEHALRAASDRDAGC